MIVNDFYLFCGSVGPDKTNPPSVINPDTLLSFTVASQRFQSVSGRDPQVLQTARTMKVQELSAGSTLECSKAWDIHVVEQCLRILTPEGPDHVPQRLLRGTYYVKQHTPIRRSTLLSAFWID